MHRPLSTHSGLFLILALTACGAAPDAAEDLAEQSSALSDPAQVMGFEGTGLWSMSAGSSSLDIVTSQGGTSLAAAVTGYAEITSVPLSTLTGLTSTLAFDVMVPYQNPLPFGYAQVFVNAPSKGLYNVYLGQKSLMSLPMNVYRSLNFTVPSNVLTALGQSYSDLTFKIVLNAPAGTYHVDNLRFVQPSPYSFPKWSVVPILFVPTDWSVSSSAVQNNASAITSALTNIRSWYATNTASVFHGGTFTLNSLQVVQANGPKENYGITWNGGNIYTDGIQVAPSFEAAVVQELNNRGYPTPPNQNVEGYATLIFMKGAGGWAGGRHFGATHGGWAILGDWCIDSLTGLVPQGAYWWSGVNLQRGAAAHELGHAFDLPHPDAYGGDFGATVMGNWWDYPSIGFDDWGRNHLYTYDSMFF